MAAPMEVDNTSADPLKKDNVGDGLLGAKTVGGIEVMPWVEKYRPRTLADLVSHQDVIQTIRNVVDQNRLPHLLLHGPPGTGKTSTILACAKEMYGSKFGSMVMDLNASDARGIDVVREQIRSFVSASTLFSKGFKLVILDESDNMTSASQFALRRIMEQYSNNARFCLICNYVNKVIPALQSRCTKFRFSPLKDEDIAGRIDYVASNEKINLTPTGKSALIKIGNGDLRKVLNIMQSASMAFDVLNEEAIHLTTGLPLPKDIDFIFDKFLTAGFTEAFAEVDAMRIKCGYGLVDLVQALFRKVNEIEWPSTALFPLVAKLADTEYRLAAGCNERIQLSAIVAAFRGARQAVAAIKQ